MSDVKILANSDAFATPFILKFDKPGAIVSGTASNPVSNIEIMGLKVLGPNAVIAYVEAVANHRIKQIYYSGRGTTI